MRDSLGGGFMRSTGRGFGLRALVAHVGGWRRRLIPSVALALALFGLAAGAPQAVAADAPRTIIVLDASGSMWGQIDGRTKIDIARQTVAKVVTSLPQDRELGLMAYGHRTKGSCTDIELLVPPARGTGPAILQAVNSMRFLGKTPLSEAVRQAAEALRFTEDAATVVLVTDGLETCSADPCALGAELERGGVDFTAHVIGFGLTKEEGAKVACLAESTGGSYFEARDAGGLAEALTKTVAQAPAKEPAAPSRPGVMFFDDDDFQGHSFFLDADTPDFTVLELPEHFYANDSARSLRVVGRWEVCEHVGYEGECRVVEGDVANLADFSGTISSLRKAGPAAAAAAGAGDGAPRFNVDLWGGDYRSIVYDAPGRDWQHCRAACAAEAQCRAWTYVVPGRQPHGECFLKDQVPEAAASDCCVSGMKGAAGERTQAPADAARTIAVTFEAAKGGHELQVSWSATPAPGQNLPPEAWAAQESASDPITAELLPGTYDVRGDAGDTVFFQRVTLSEGGPTRFVIPVSKALSPAGEDEVTAPGGNAGKGFTCDGTVACQVEDGASGLAFVLPAGWRTDAPFLAETAGGAKASRPTLTFTDGVPHTVVLNPLRWLESNGSCLDTTAGRLCLMLPASESAQTAFSVIAGSLRFAPPR